MSVEPTAIALLAFLAWRERQHALERAALLSRRGTAPPSLAASSRRREKGRARVISAEDDAGFLESRGQGEET
jgi:hypothetical protein